VRSSSTIRRAITRLGSGCSWLSAGRRGWRGLEPHDLLPGLRPPAGEVAQSGVPGHRALHSKLTVASARAEALPGAHVGSSRRSVTTRPRRIVAAGGHAPWR
jgi:hypothetical protein